MEQIKFDPHQFLRRYVKPVSAETGIDYSDYERMGTYSHKTAGERRLPTPEWALNDDQLRSVIVRYMEVRARISPAENLSMQQRLERARKKLLERIPVASETLTALCKRYVKYKQFVAKLSQATARQRMTLRQYENEIEGLDTVLRMGDCAGIVLRVVHLYYRVPMDSVGVGFEVHLKPGHVRQIVWRLNQIANGKGPKHHGGTRKRTFDHDVAYALRALGHTYREIADELGACYETVRQALVRIENKRKEVKKMDKATIQQHYKKLKAVANKNGGKLPSVKTLEANGLFYSYDVVRMAGLLGNFDRVILGRGHKAA